MGVTLFLWWSMQGMKKALCLILPWIDIAHLQTASMLLSTACYLCHVGSCAVALCFPSLDWVANIYEKRIINREAFHFRHEFLDE